MYPRTAVFLSLLIAAAAGSAADWPGWRGPDRTGLSTEKGLLTQWPSGGPALLWKVSGLGDGYSTPAIAAGRIYLLGTKESTEFVRCLDVNGGKELWAREIGPIGRVRYPGPRSTPTVDGDRVYALTSSGSLACLDTGKGTVHWKRNLLSDFRGSHGSWAYAESPLVDGDRVICTPGGEDATLVCLAKGSGKEIWRTSIRGLKGKPAAAGSEPRKGKGKGKGRMRGPRPYAQAGYASAVVAELGGVRQYVQFLAGGVVGIRAADGKLLWHHELPPGSNANAATPIVKDDSVFVAAGYGVGGARARIVGEGEAQKAEQVYFVKEMQNHHGGMLLIDGHLYGTNNAGLVCLEFATGKVRWTARGVGKGSITYADGHLYYRGENGDVALVEVDPRGYREKGRFRQPNRSDQRAWAHPVLADGRLYLRDWDTLLCYDVRGKR